MSAGQITYNLLKEFSRGNTDAGKILFAHAKRIAQYVLGPGTRVPKEDLEEIVYDALMDMYMNLRDLKDPSKASSWAYRIVQNRVFSYLRKKKCPVDSLEELAGEDAIDGSPLPDEQLEEKQLRQLIEKWFNSLPEKKQRVLQARHDHPKRTYKKLGELLGMKEDCVRIALGRLESELRHLMDRHGYHSNVHNSGG